MADILTEILNKAAKEHLQPLGLFQKGRSRTWLSDEGWWSIVVEFQPSGFSKGSYLNVACMWLWLVKPYVSFDLGSREEHFERFENEAQFGPLAQRFALRAAKLALKYRAQFPTVSQLSAYFLKHAPVAGWSSYDAGIAHALAGRSELAKKLLSESFSGDDRIIDWVIKARCDSELLGRMVDDTDRFRRVIEDRIHETRALFKLPKLDHVTFD